jgi:hypothetical protein
VATTVAVFGGGVGGLSAAHELVERGFSVTVYEKRGLAGGKARSYPSPEGRPAEHGFRFFPAFYRHLPDTMARIPSGNGSARDRLAGAERILFARAGGANELLAPAHAPGTLADLAVLARFVFDAATQLGVPAVDIAWLLERLFTLLASCDERRVAQWDLESWWDFVQADQRSEEFRRYLADGLTRTLVAARAKELSARTGGLVLVQLLLDLSRAAWRCGSGRPSRVLSCARVVRSAPRSPGGRSRRTSCSPPTTCARTRTWRRGRARTRRPGGPSTRFWTLPGLPRGAARCGRCASRRRCG